MIAYLPVAGGHIKLAERFVDPAFAFALGWNLWYNWTVLISFHHIFNLFSFPDVIADFTWYVFDPSKIYWG